MEEERCENCIYWGYSWCRLHEAWKDEDSTCEDFDSGEEDA